MCSPALSEVGIDRRGAVSASATCLAKVAEHPLMGVRDDLDDVSPRILAIARTNGPTLKQEVELAPLAASVRRDHTGEMLCVSGDKGEGEDASPPIDERIGWLLIFGFDELEQLDRYSVARR